MLSARFWTAHDPERLEQRGLIVAHNDPGVRAADEVTPISGFDPDRPQPRRGLLRLRVWVRRVI